MRSSMMIKLLFHDGIARFMGFASNPPREHMFCSLSLCVAMSSLTTARYQRLLSVQSAAQVFSIVSSDSENEIECLRQVCTCSRSEFDSLSVRRTLRSRRSSRAAAPSPEVDTDLDNACQIGGRCSRTCDETRDCKQSNDEHLY